MSWWGRYQAWRPEGAWDRYQIWRLESPARFTATGVGARLLIVLLVSLLSGSLSERTVLATAFFVVVATVLWWFIYYPRAVAKGPRASISAGPARDRRGAGG